MKELNKAKELQDLHSLASNVNMLIMAYKMNQSNLASAVGVPQATINRLVNGKSMPKVSTIKNIATHYGVSIDALLRANSLTIEHSDGVSESSGLLNRISNLFRAKRADNANS
tara:strand:+ start:376 stop:714 length:339 start_codon:yes stop_codon:yes gene_type:complete